MVLVENFLEVYCRQSPGARFDFRNCFIDHLWSDHLSCQLCCCHPFQFNTTSVCSRMLRTSDKRKMKLGFHVLLRSTLPNSCLAIPGTLAFQDRVYQSCSSFRWNMNNIPFLSRFFLKLGQCSLRFFVSWSS